MDPFEAPSPQTIVVIGTSPFVTITAPELNRNYRNINVQNQDYANMRITHFDIPAYDNLGEIFGESFTFDIVTTVISADYGWISDSNYAAATSMKSNVTVPFASITSITRDVVQVPLTITVPVRKVGESLAETISRVRQQITASFRDDQSRLGFQDLLGQYGTDSWLSQVFIAHFRDLYIDASIGKLALELDPVRMDSKYRFTRLHTSGFFPNQVSVATILGFEITFKQTETIQYSPRQIKYLSSILGGEISETNNTHFQTKFSFDPKFSYYYNNQASILAYNNLMVPTLYQLQRYLMVNDEVKATTNEYDLGRGLTGYIAFSQMDPKATISDYVYIKGAPEISFFDGNGRSLDAMEILPRNRELGGIPTVASTNPLSYNVKTSLASLRNMTLALTDVYGVAIPFGGEYMLKIVISYS